MRLEDFIGWFLRLKAKDYLAFKDFDDIPVPSPPAKDIELYIHVPFCEQLCPYCSFHRFLFRESLAREYFDALRKEIRIYKDLGYKFGGVYVGGGTPTILMDELLKTLELVGDLFSPDEISVETNPDRLQVDILKDLVSLGVKRVSVGIQSFDDDILRKIGRYSKYGSGEELIIKVKDVMGVVKTLNLDMIYNFPGQTRGVLDRDIDIISSMRPDQVTFYPLMISDSTRKTMESLMGEVDYRKEASFYSIIRDRLSSLYEPSTAWCFSKSGSSMIDEYIVKYDQYAGVGSGSFGLVGNSIYSNTFSLEEYIGKLDEGRLPLKTLKVFSPKEMARYFFLMSLFGLRLERDVFRDKFGKDICKMLWPECMFFILSGGIKVKDGRVDLTRRGEYYWVVMMREFFIGVDNFRDQARKSIRGEIAT